MIRKTVFNRNLRRADSYTVECGKHHKTFFKGCEKAVGEWVKQIWNDELFPQPAYVYLNIGWDNDHVLYCKYEMK